MASQDWMTLYDQFVQVIKRVQAGSNDLRVALKEDPEFQVYLRVFGRLKMEKMWKQYINERETR